MKVKTFNCRASEFEAQIATWLKDNPKIQAKTTQQTIYTGAEPDGSGVAMMFFTLFYVIRL